MELRSSRLAAAADAGSASHGCPAAAGNPGNAPLIDSPGCAKEHNRLAVLSRAPALPPPDSLLGTHHRRRSHSAPSPHTVRDSALSIESQGAKTAMASPPSLPDAATPSVSPRKHTSRPWRQKKNEHILCLFPAANRPPLSVASAGEVGGGGGDTV